GSGKRFMPGRNGIISGGHTFDLILAVLAGYGEERMIEYACIAIHPAMDIAFDWNHHFDFIERSFFIRRSGRLTFVELVVLITMGMDIMKRLIGIFNIEFLPNHNA